jgi:hypothetical protein
MACRLYNKSRGIYFHVSPRPCDTLYYLGAEFSAFTAIKYIPSLTKLPRESEVLESPRQTLLGQLHQIWQLTCGSKLRLNLRGG